MHVISYCLYEKGLCSSEDFQRENYMEFYHIFSKHVGYLHIKGYLFRPYT